MLLLHGQRNRSTSTSTRCPRCVGCLLEEYFYDDILWRNAEHDGARSYTLESERERRWEAGDDSRTSVLSKPRELTAPPRASASAAIEFHSRACLTVRLYCTVLHIHESRRQRRAERSSFARSILDVRIGVIARKISARFSPTKGVTIYKLSLRASFFSPFPFSLLHFILFYFILFCFIFICAFVLFFLPFFCLCSVRTVRADSLEVLRSWLEKFAPCRAFVKNETCELAFSHLNNIVQRFV